jgi:hypothetical protein
MLKVKWKKGITNGEVFQRAKKGRLLLEILKNRHRSWMRHIIRRNEFAVNIVEGAISGKKNGVGRPRKQVARYTAADSCTSGLLQFQMESCQPNKREE